jgi:dephospho-CoA kinase
MQIVGITGGIGVGKSYILRHIQEGGYPVYSADERAKWLMENDLRQEIEEIIGPEAYTPEGKLNRAYISRRIFADPALRHRLNAVVHPRTLADFVKWVQVQAQEGYPAVFKEAAITLEAGATQGLSCLVVVYAPLAVRLRRLQDRDGLSPEASMARMRSQWPDWRKVAYADFVLFNDGALPIVPQLQALFQYLRLSFPR